MSMIGISKICTVGLPLRLLCCIWMALNLAPPSTLRGAATASDASWPGFRGPSAMPVSENEKLPLRWSTTENVEWRAEVPGMGWSSPIEAGGMVLVTTATSSTVMKPPQIGTDYSNEYLAELTKQGLSEEDVLRKLNERDLEMPNEIELEYLLIAYELETGSELWRRSLFKGRPPGGRHRKNSFTSETPVTDGDTVFVYIGNLGLWAFALDGELRWHKELDAFQIYLDFGTGGSPALVDDRVVILNDNEESQFIAAYAKKDGRELWRTARDLASSAHPSRSSWATPFVWRTPARTEIVAPGPSTAVSYDLRGRELWRMSNHSALSAPSPFAYDGHLFLISGVPGEAYRPIAAIRPGASGDLTLEDGATSSEYVRWYDKAAGTYIPTPVAYRGSLWVLYDKGILARYQAADGQRVFRARIAGSAGAFTASPWAYRGKIFAIDEDGSTFVFEAVGKFEQLHENALDEMVLASPAIVGERLLIRTRSHLYSIRDR